MQQRPDKQDSEKKKCILTKKRRKHFLKPVRHIVKSFEVVLITDLMLKTHMHADFL